LARPGPPDSAGFELPLLLFAGFRALIDDLHAELAARGHPQVRPAYGFAMQAIGPHGATASDLGRLLGVSKQAAGKTVEALALSAAIFEDLRARWASTLGTRRLRELEGSLRIMAPQGSFRLDVPGWFGS
jgi:sirohydrochlorin ferrochelatase